MSMWPFFLIEKALDVGYEAGDSWSFTHNQSSNLSGSASMPEWDPSEP